MSQGRNPHSVPLPDPTDHSFLLRLARRPDWMSSNYSMNCSIRSLNQMSTHWPPNLGRQKNPSMALRQMAHP
jgi:hypothetical protein